MESTTSTLHTTPCVNLTTKMGTKQTSYLTSSKYVYIKMLVFHTIIKYWKGALSLSVVEKNYQPLSQCDSVVYWYFSEGYKSLIHESGKNKNISLSLKLWQYKHQTETFQGHLFPAVLRWRHQQHFKSYTVLMEATTSTLHTTPCVNLTTKRIPNKLLILPVAICLHQKVCVSHYYKLLKECTQSCCNGKESPHQTYQCMMVALVFFWRLLKALFMKAVKIITFTFLKTMTVQASFTWPQRTVRRTHGCRNMWNSLNFNGCCNVTQVLFNPV